MKLLVQFSEKNYVIKVPSLNSISELKSHIRGSLNNELSKFDLQYYDEDFKTYAELISIHDVANMTKLKVEVSLDTKKPQADTSKRKKVTPTIDRTKSLSPQLLSNGKIPEIVNKPVSKIPLLDLIFSGTSKPTDSVSIKETLPPQQLCSNSVTTDSERPSNHHKRPTEDDLRGTKRKRHDNTSDVKRRQDLSKVLLAAGGLPNFLPERRKGQSNEEVEKLKSFMSKEVRAEAPEFTKVSQALEHTLADRRKYILYGDHDINEMHRCYPWIFTEKELIREFSRICNEDMKMKDKVFEYFCNVAPYVKTLVKKTKIDKYLEMYPSTHQTEALNEKKKKNCKFNDALIGIPILLGEDASNLFVKETDSCSFVSRICIHYAGGSPYRDGHPYTLCVDGRHVTLTSRRSALCASIAAHYAFNIGYCAQLYNFFTFVEHDVFKLRTCQGPPSVVKRMVTEFKDLVDKDKAAGAFRMTDAKRGVSRAGGNYS